MYAHWWFVLLLTGCVCPAVSPKAMHLEPSPRAVASGPLQGRQELANPGSAAEAPCPRSTGWSTDALVAEVECHLQRYIQVDTTNPPGRELYAARFLQTILEGEGIPARLLQSAPDRANLYARLPGSRPGHALVLMHHMDVVPAVEAEWSVPPFGGLVRGGELWGRGALDNKGMGILQLMTLLMLKRSGVQLPYDVILLAVADEEAGGALGARWLVSQQAALFEGVSMVLNEGGAIVETEPGKRLYSIEVAQKAPLWLRVTASGVSGHGSTPRVDAATHRLIRALSRLQAHPFPITVTPEVQAMFKARAAWMAEPERSKYGDLQAALQEPAFRDQFMADPHQAALVQTTASITMLSGSDKENVLPGQASAVLDLRLLPGQRPDELREQLQQIMQEPDLQLETLLSWQAYPSAVDTPMFASIQQLAAQIDEGAPVTANFIGGFTDCNAFRAVGIPCYGFMPMRLSPTSFGLIHGKDERIRLVDLAQAVIDLATLLRLRASQVESGER